MGERRAPLGPVTPLAPAAVLVILAGGRARRYGGCKPLAPVGPDGEAVLDVVASDAIAVGFTTIVVVIGPETGAAIRYHVRRSWPATVDVRFAEQAAPLGTVHAVLSAEDHLAESSSFAVANADDVYGADALRLAADHTLAEDEVNALVGFRLANAVVGDEPVTRGICTVDGNGLLAALDERRKVRARGDGWFDAGDGRQPATLPGDSLVSMNLWVFRPAMRPLFHEAMEAASATQDSEVLLPEVVGSLLERGGPAATSPAMQFRVLPTDSRCIGVTHPDDLGIVRSELAQHVGRGIRPASLWADGA